MSAFERKVNEAGQADISRLPRHIAIIMDGNGRWAKKRGLPRNAGHKVGAETFRKIAAYCRDIGIEYLTVYAFSTENWKRPPEEVNTIMELLKRYMLEAVETMERDHIKLRFLGDLDALSPELQALAHKTDALSAHITGAFQVNVCLNYGGRAEILRAARACAQSGEEITEERFSRCLYTADMPDPELIIRPGGEQRISNFLLWQCAYSELYFCDTLWPDFDEKTLQGALDAYCSRERRFGAVR